MVIVVDRIRISLGGSDSDIETNSDVDEDIFQEDDEDDLSQV
jgi:hypothetical protein